MNEQIFSPLQVVGYAQGLVLIHLVEPHLDAYSDYPVCDSLKTQQNSMESFEKDLAMGFSKNPLCTRMLVLCLCLMILVTECSCSKVS
jgi:hypothetical protein